MEGIFIELSQSHWRTSMVEAGSMDFRVGLSITGAGVAKVVKKLHGSMAPAVDKIHPDFFNAQKVVGLSWCYWIGFPSSKLGTGWCALK